MPRRAALRAAQFSARWRDTHYLHTRAPRTWSPVRESNFLSSDHRSGVDAKTPFKRQNLAHALYASTDIGRAGLPQKLSGHVLRPSPTSPDTAAVWPASFTQNLSRLPVRRRFWITENKHKAKKKKKWVGLVASVRMMYVYHHHRYQNDEKMRGILFWQIRNHNSHFIEIQLAPNRFKTLSNLKKITNNHRWTNLNIVNIRIKLKNK